MLGEKTNTIKENTDALLEASGDIGLEVNKYIATRVQNKIMIYCLLINSSKRW